VWTKKKAGNGHTNSLEWQGKLRRDGAKEGLKKKAHTKNEKGNDVGLCESLCDKKVLKKKQTDLGWRLKGNGRDGEDEGKREENGGAKNS